jgi:hypothetical protein
MKSIVTNHRGGLTRPIPALANGDSFGSAGKWREGGGGRRRGKAAGRNRSRLILLPASSPPPPPHTHTHTHNKPRRKNPVPMPPIFLLRVAAAPPQIGLKKSNRSEYIRCHGEKSPMNYSLRACGSKPSPEKKKFLILFNLY